MKISKKLQYLLLATICFLSFGVKTCQAQAALHHFVWDDIHTTQYAGQPIYVRIRAVTYEGELYRDFNDAAQLSDDTGTLSAGFTGNFSGGIWYGSLFITKAENDIQMHAIYDSHSGSTNEFTVIPDNRMKIVSIVSGNYQTGVVYDALPQALRIKIADHYNNAVPGINVNFVVSSYPPNSTLHLLSSTTGTSDSNGLVSSTFRLGQKNGTYIVDASMVTGITNTVQFYETAVADTTVRLDITPSTAVLVGGAYVQFGVNAFDKYMNSVPISNAVWSVVNGGGTINANTGYFKAGDATGNYLNTVKVNANNAEGFANLNVITPGGEAAGTSGQEADSYRTSTASTVLLPEEIQLLRIDPEFISALSGATIPITATALDAFGAPVPGVSYNFSTSGSLGTLSDQAGNTILLTASENGIGTVTVTATKGQISKVAKIVGSVGTGLNRRLVIDPIPSPQKVGEPFMVSIAAKDSLNNFLNDYGGALSITDTTGTFDPPIASSSASGIWYVQGIVELARDQVTITVAGDGMIGVSNIFSVEGEPNADEVTPSIGLGDIKGSSIAAQIKDFLVKGGLMGGGGDGSGFTSFKYLGAGLAAGIGILGASIGGSMMIGKALEALGRNPFAKGKLQVNLYGSIFAFVIAAGLALTASILILR